MAVSPFTLNNLYSQGIIDYVPYDLCSGGANVASFNGMHNPYLSAAQNGALYQQHGVGQDYFIGHADSENNGSGSNNAINKILNLPSWVKGLGSLAIIVGTLGLIFKTGGKSKHKVSNSSFRNFFSKLNPVNWFKKQNKYVINK